ncbi:MAG TPA: 2-dehydropantoate 2-reductase [Burkholderiales bacterium]|nr:2-dehydropantoate 2-reductase [Burkholderiales bacterium]
MTKRIAIVGAGALGGYVGGNFARQGLDVTLIDPWPENVDIIRARGLELDGLTPEEQFTVKPKIIHVTEVQGLARTPVDVAFVAMKSYDTLWATALIAPYLAEQGFVVSLQNCMNEETIAGVVGWGRTVGVVASQISVDLYEAGRIRRTIPKGGDKYTIFRVGEPHGRITPRVEELVGWFRGIDSAKATTNLWGERWSKLVQNAMGNGVTAATGMTTPACLADAKIRRFQIALAGEGVRVGQALGYTLEKIRAIEPELYARAAEGDGGAMAQIESVIVPKANPRGDIQRPSMAQDILKGRRTEIDAMNGYIARKGAEVGVSAPSHSKLAAIVTRVERGEVRPSPALLA